MTEIFHHHSKGYLWLQRFSYWTACHGSFSDWIAHGVMDDYGFLQDVPEMIGWRHYE